MDQINSPEKMLTEESHAPDIITRELFLLLARESSLKLWQIAAHMHYTASLDRAVPFAIREQSWCRIQNRHILKQRWVFESHCRSTSHSSTTVQTHYRLAAIEEN